jgi:hypothetical protein
MYKNFVGSKNAIKLVKNKSKSTSPKKASSKKSTSPKKSKEDDSDVEIDIDEFDEQKLSSLQKKLLDCLKGKK